VTSRRAAAGIWVHDARISHANSPDHEKAHLAELEDAGLVTLADKG
jgi:hypothetical protein